MTKFEDLKDEVLKRLDTELDKSLTYHSARHTRDVMRSTSLLAKSEKVEGKNQELLMVAALLHDSGFLLSLEEHEKYGCRIAHEVLPRYGYNQEAIETVCRLIMATKVPQQPSDLLESIICDADLDYLGREDFFELGEGLYKEFMAHGIVSNYREWDLIQIKFLSMHEYFTQTNQEARQPLKAVHLELIKERVSQVPPSV